MKSDSKYIPSEIEAKWQDKWESDKVYSPNIDSAKNPFYNLMMFPYPSAEGLHVGNMYAFTGADVYGRFKRMQGNEVFEPIGLDGFGIHSENYALKVGKHPKEQAEISEKNFYRQLRSIGNSFDLTRTVETYKPDYYQWTQWLFIQMFKNGLAYRKKAEVNWCPKDLTVLSDEQVIAGECERCGTKVEKRELEQWFFRITDYAQRLLDNIEKLDWTEKVKIAQKNWIGRSEGAEIEFEIEGLNAKLKVFTTRPDTLFGATFMVVAPEHEIVTKLLSELSIKNEVLGEVKGYIEKAKSKTDIERTAEGKEKTGVFTGLYAINPVNNKKIPVWVADYVLSSYGTGAIMAVPAHDQRDFEFANKYDLEIIPVIQSKGSSNTDVKMTEAFSGQGTIIGSEGWNGFHVPEDISKVIDDLESKGLGTKKVNYHLRDWLISRQRYWGPPIPMVFCQDCADNSKGEREEMPGWYSEKEENLPVKLPDVKDWKPMGTGKAPLANHPEFYETTCPSCGAKAVRETDVSDTFLDSSWYFLRYPNTDIQNEAFDTERVRKWLPVNMYIGGAEHSVLHLLYSRFVTMVLKDLNFIDFEEPFSRFYAHGLIIKDGAKMSKSKGNVVVPDEYISKYGADSLRTYLMFLGPYSDGGDFRDSGIEGIYKYLKRVWKLLSRNEPGDLNDERAQAMHKTIKKVTEDISNLRYNTAIASLMEWYNFLNTQVRSKNQELSREEKEVYLKLLSPFAPHLTEELWQISRGPAASQSHSTSSAELTGAQWEPSFRVTPDFKSIHLESWPEYDESKISNSKLIIVVQVNGKRRGEIAVENSELRIQNVVEQKARELVVKYLEGKDIKKIIYVPGKIINFVV